MQPHTMPVPDICKFWLRQFPLEFVRVPYGTLAGPARALYGSHRIWKTLKILVWGLYDACTGITRGPCGVLRIILSNHKCTAVSSHTGPVAWCDNENSTGVKFLWALHLALWARNCTGAKNCTGPVVGCDWSISATFIRDLMVYPLGLM